MQHDKSEWEELLESMNAICEPRVKAKIHSLTPIKVQTM